MDFVRLPWATAIVVCVLASLACGGGSSTSSGSSSGTVVNPPSTGTSTGQLAPPTSVTVAAGSTTSGVALTVPGVASAPLNAEALGVASLNSSGGSASNTGAIVQRGAQALVLIFGKGLSANVTVSIFGPDDVTISGVTSIKSTTGTPGVQFTINVSSSATPGARTVALQDSSGNVTTFTGGLEIQ